MRIATDHRDDVSAAGQRTTATSVEIESARGHIADYELDDYEVRPVGPRAHSGQFCVRPLVGLPKSIPCLGS
jgi:hypothetical protein